MIWGIGSSGGHWEFKGDSALRCWGTVEEVGGSGKAVTRVSPEMKEIRGGRSLG